MFHKAFIPPLSLGAIVHLTLMYALSVFFVVVSHVLIEPRCCPPNYLNVYLLRTNFRVNMF